VSEPANAPLRAGPLSADDQPALRAFYRAVWGSGDSEEEQDDEAKTQPPCPFTSTPRPVVGVYSGTELIGHLGSIPTEIWDGERSAPAHWLKGFMVLEPYRNGPIGYQLVKEMMKQVGVAGVMTVAPAARRLFQVVGFKDLGAVPNYITVIRPGRILRALDVQRLGLTALPRPLRSLLKIARWPPAAWAGGILGAAGLSLLDGVNRLRGLGVQARLTATPPPMAEIDAVWQKLRPQLNLAPSRSGPYMHWRYTSSPGRYEFIEIRRRGALVGLLVIRRPERVDDPRLAGLRLGLVVDLVLDPTDRAAGIAGFLAARRWGKKTGCDAVLLTLSHLGVGRLVKPLGFVKIPGNVHFMLRAPAGALSAPTDTGRSWLTRGDAWGDDI